MKALNRQTASVAPPYPECILQFGGGNFLRGFVDWIIDVYNEKTGAEMGVLVVKPTEQGDYRQWRAQEGLFHVLIKGIQNGALVDKKRLIKCVGRIIHPYREWDAFLRSAANPALRYIISNTTENGLRFSAEDKKTDAPPAEFPAKLTLWLYRRFQYFDGNGKAGCILFPTELLIDNGELLKNCILQYAGHWQLGEGFKRWILEANIFCNTLVDRIVPGIAENQLEEAWAQTGFTDQMITQGEPYHFWAIEAPLPVREALPLDKTGLNVLYTDDLSPYRTIKVRILNGAHTAMAPAGYLCGIETVRETVEDALMGKFVREVIFNEIIPTLDMPEEDLRLFAGDVLDRFRNPFIRHRLISIALHSISKFKSRILPSLLAYEQRMGTLPPGLVFSLAALIRFYKGEYRGKEIPLQDDQDKIDFFARLWSAGDGSAAAISKVVDEVLQWEEVWETDLSKVAGLKEMTTRFLLAIEKAGMREAVKNLSIFT